MAALITIEVKSKGTQLVILTLIFMLFAGLAGYKIREDLLITRQRQNITATCIHLEPHKSGPLPIFSFTVNNLVYKTSPSFGSPFMGAKIGDKATVIFYENDPSYCYLDSFYDRFLLVGIWAGLAIFMALLIWFVFNKKN